MDKFSSVGLKVRIVEKELWLFSTWLTFSDPEPLSYLVLEQCWNPSHSHPEPVYVPLTLPSASDLHAILSCVGILEDTSISSAYT